MVHIFCPVLFDLLWSEPASNALSVRPTPQVRPKAAKVSPTWEGGVRREEACRQCVVVMGRLRPNQFSKELFNKNDSTFQFSFLSNIRSPRLAPST